MLKNTLGSWGLVSRIFHWLMALMIITLLTVGLIMTDMSPSEQKWQLYNLHKAAGVTVLGLAIARLVWRLSQPIPLLPATLPKWQAIASRLNIFLLYCLLFCMPLSGFVMSVFGGHDISYFGIFTIKAFTHTQTDLSKTSHTLHIFLGYVVIFSVCLHIAAALYHHFILKDHVLSRMIRG